MFYTIKASHKRTKITKELSIIYVQENTYLISVGIA